MAIGNGPKGHEPIAIVGIGCRFADNSSSPSKLWDMLKDGRSGQSDIPKNRFDIDSWFSATKGRPGSMYSRGGYFLSHDDSYRSFDPSFFGISPLEGTSMDPQQRKLLEVVYECFESAGKSLEDISGSDTACYVGCFSTDFEHIQTKDPEYSVPYQSTGSGLTILSNRVNYTFNLKGPSLTVDTACSSSLYALHLACQSLLAGDCTAAVVGGSSLIASVEKHIGSGRLGILSPSSTCHTFDASADGFGRGDGIAAIYLKPLSTAIADGDPIRAVIRATAINSNGKGPGINHPGPEAQEAVIRKAYERASLDFSKTGYFECHGTGTPVGDPIECTAIGNVFAEGRSANNPLLIGSVKTNLGHCEGASGLAGIIKAVLSLEKGLIPPTVGVKKLNPNIDFKNGRLEVVRSLTPWPENLKYRRISVNGFGYGGANAHAILDATDSYFEGDVSFLSTKEPPEKKAERSYLLPFSAHDETTLKLNVDAISKVCRNYDLSSLAHTLSRRPRFRSRAFGICKEGPALSETSLNNVIFGTPENSVPNIAFVFTGQGAQWPQMGYTLIQQYPSFRRTIERLEKSLSISPSPPDFSIIEVLSAPKDTSTIYHSIRSPVCCTAVQIALTILLRSWGIHPTAIVGHSAGEIAAAFAAGRITGSEAVAIAHYRGLAVLNCKEDGAMLAVGLGAKEVQPYLEGQPDVIIGCYNSPQSVTLSGGEHAVEEIRKSLTDAGIFARKVNSSGNAYHSHLMRSAAKEFQNLFQSTYAEMIRSPTRDKRLPRTPMYSCITGELLEIDEIPFTHWQMNLESPVLFDQATALLLKSEPAVNHLIEIGAHSALAGPVRQIINGLGFDQLKVKYLPTLIRGQDGVDNMLQLAGKLSNLDYPVDLIQINSIQHINLDQEIDYRQGKFLTDLPSYQWNYDSLLWKDNRWSREQRFRTHCRHDILGSREPGGSQNSPLWRNHLEIKHVPWLLDHKIGEDIIFPAAGYIAMVVEALNQIAEYRELLVPSQGYTLSGLKIASAMIIPVDGSVETLLNMRELPDGNSDKTVLFDFNVSSVREDGKWSEHAKGKIRLVTPKECHQKSLPGIKRAKISNAKSWYKALSAVGVEFGPAFQTLSGINLVTEHHAAIADIDFQTTRQIMGAESRYIMHPTALDGCLQLSVMAAHGDIKSENAYLPVSVEDLTVWTPDASDVPTQKGIIHARGNIHGLRSVNGSVDVFSKSGNLLLEGKFSFISLEGGLKSSEPTFPRKPYTRFVWKPDVDRLGALCTGLIDRSSDINALPQRIKNFGLSDFMELLSHKGRPVNILHIGCFPVTEDHEVTEKCTEREEFLHLHQGSTRPIYSSYTVTDRDAVLLDKVKEKLVAYDNVDFRSLDIEQSLDDQGFGKNSYDIVIFSQALGFEGTTYKAIENCMHLLKPAGKLIVDTRSWDTIPQTTCFEILREIGFQFDQLEEAQPTSTVVAEKVSAREKASNNLETLWLIYLHTPNGLIEKLSTIATENGILTRSVSLSDAAEKIPKRANIIMTAELEAPVLAHLQNETLASLKYLFQQVSSAIWITNGGLLNGVDPGKCLASGIAKTLMTEYPSLRLSCYDIDPKESNLTRSAVYIFDQYLRLQDDDISEVNMDLIEKDGLVCISRLIPDDVENSAFDRIVNVRLEDQPLDHGMELDFQRVGHIDSFYYKPTVEDFAQRSLQPGELLLESEAYSLSAMEAAILKGQRDSEFFSHEVVGIIRAVGSEVCNYKPGDRVISLHPGKFETSPFVMQDSCYKLLPNEKMDDIIGALSPLCTALYTVDNLLRPRKRDVILIHLPNDPFLASILAQICRHRDSKIIITYNLEHEEIYLKSIHMPQNSLINTSHPNWPTKIGDLTERKGISSIIASTDADCHQDLWKQLRKNGKYLILGDKAGIPDMGTFSHSVFARGASFASLDTLDIIHGDDEEIKYLIDEALRVFRSGSLSPLPEASVFEISDLSNAVINAVNMETLNRTIVRYSSASTVPMLKKPKPLSLNQNAAFLLIGCLGGLGRSLTHWMLSRGARHFIFLSRSGAKSKDALVLLEELDELSKERGGSVTYQVVCGDVSVREDVDKAISAATLPIRGVVQAAAVFKESLFESMTAEKFNAVLNPKVQGTINLHEALINEPLDFFVMTSSTLGIKGPATESGYAAANAFLDSMARHRWNLGMQATSLALGMVQEIGHIEEHPEIEAALLQNGLYGINEAEFQIMMELACRSRDLSSPPSNSSPWDPYASAHIVTGLEMNRMDPNPNLTAFSMRDKRFRHLVFSDAGSDIAGASSQNSGTTNILADALKSGEEVEIKSAVRQILFSRFSKLVMVPVGKLELGISRPLADFGMDSMVSSEVRSIVWKEFKADIPFMKVLEKGLLLGELLDLVWEKMDPILKGESM